MTLVVAAVAAAIASATASNAAQVVAPGLACPRNALALTKEGMARAKRVAFEYATEKTRIRTRGAKVVAVHRATDWAKGGFVKTSCGSLVSRRTLVVSMLFPAERYAHPEPSARGPCNACAAVDFLVSRTNARWLVWYVL